MFTMLAKGRSSWWAVPFGLLVGVGFLASPVVLALGVGPFGREFGWQFGATVVVAHAAFGLALARLVGPLTRRHVGPDPNLVSGKTNGSMTCAV